MNRHELDAIMRYVESMTDSAVLESNGFHTQSSVDLTRQAIKRAFITEMADAQRPDSVPPEPSHPMEQDV